MSRDKQVNDEVTMIVRAAGLDAPRQLANAVEKDSALTGCGDEHVEAVVRLVLEWRRKAVRMATSSWADSRVQR